MKPNVFRSCSRYSGVRPIAATAMDGSVNSRFFPERIVVAERIAGHHASTSSMTNSFSNAFKYESSVGMVMLPAFAVTSFRILDFFARVEMFLAYERRINPVHVGLRWTPSTVEISDSQILLI